MLATAFQNYHASQLDIGINCSFAFDLSPVQLTCPTNIFEIYLCTSHAFLNFIQLYILTASIQIEEHLFVPRFSLDSESTPFSHLSFMAVNPHSSIPPDSVSEELASPELEISSSSRSSCNVPFGKQIKHAW